MELEKKTNLRSLIPAVLVGLLALAANEYTKMDPALLRDSVEAMEQRVAVLMKGDGKPKHAKPPLAKLTKLQDATREKFETWRANRHPTRLQEIRSTIGKADALYTSVCEDAEVKPDDKSQANLLRTSIYFMAAERSPTTYSRQFIEMADAVIATEPPKVMDPASVLRFYHLTDFGDPDDGVLLGDLRTFSERHGRESSIELYSMVSAELWRRGHRQLSLDVLNQGIRLLAGSVGISRLVNQLIDQQQL